MKGFLRAADAALSRFAAPSGVVRKLTSGRPPSLTVLFISPGRGEQVHQEGGFK